MVYSPFIPPFLKMRERLFKLDKNIKYSDITEEAADKYFKVIIENWSNDVVIERHGICEKIVLIHLSKYKCLPCYDVHCILQYLINERDLHKKVIGLEEIGLIEIISPKDNFLRTPFYRCTNLGRRVGEKLTEYDNKNDDSIAKMYIKLVELKKFEKEWKENGIPVNKGPFEDQLDELMKKSLDEIKEELRLSQ